jgi:hypothetical protein
VVVPKWLWDTNALWSRSDLFANAVMAAVVE